MKKLLAFFAVVMAAISASAENYSLYTSKNKDVINPMRTDVFGADIVSNTYEDGVGKILFDDEVTMIGEKAFSECYDLASVTIPELVTEIGNEAFASCISLNSLAIPESVTEIGESAFTYCTEITSFTIPESVAKIGKRAFAGCSSLSAFYGKFATEDNRCLVVDGEMIAFARAGISAYEIPLSVTSIGEGAFYNCYGLKSLTIPETVTSIGKEAMAYCYTLSSLTIGNSVLSIGEDAFSYCTVLSSFEIPESVETIGNGAFDGCHSLGTITIPESVTSIGTRVFAGCSALTAFYGKFASEDNRFLIDDGALIAFAPSGLTSYQIPASVTKIAEYSFKDCVDLTTVSIPNSVKEIDEFVFMECFSLKTLTLGKSLTAIGASAFKSCYNLAEIISLNTTPPSVGEEAFIDVNKDNCLLKVAAVSVGAYKSAEVWKDFLNIVALSEEEYEALDVKEVQNADRGMQTAFDLQGRMVGEDYRGIVVRNGKKVLRK